MATCGYDDDGVKTTQLAPHQGRHVRRLPDDARSGAPHRPEGVARLQLRRQLGVDSLPAHAERLARSRARRTSAKPDIIAATDDGVYVKGDASYSIDHQRYNFQFSGQTFWEVKNGKITTQLRDLAYQSNTPEFWKSCDMLGGKSTYQLGGAFSDGKGQPVAEQLRQPRLPDRALRAGQHPQHGTVTR